ncbi:MAG: serine/threonine protein kinase, partial [Halovenus sp.]
VGLIPVYRHFDNPASYLDPRYGAPEYYDGRYGSIDHWTDIYQLGMALYSAFTGDPPYSGTFEDIKSQVLTDRPLGMSTDNPDLPGSLAEVLAKATAREKLKRYETAHQFHNAISAVCDEFLE